MSAGIRIDGSVIIDTSRNIVSAANAAFTGNVTVGGDLTVGGNTIVLNTTQLEIDDNIVHIGGNNAADVIDLGWVAHYNNGQSNHAGVFRDATDGVFYVFGSYTKDEVEGLTIDRSDPSFALADFAANTFIGNMSGNANTASALATSRTISLDGDLSGSADFDGSSNITITAELTDTGVSANTYGSSSKIPQFTVDVDGRITAVTELDVAGVSSLTFTSANSTLTIGTADGSSFSVFIDSFDNLDATQFLRSDEADTKTSGDLSFSDNVKAIFGDGSDLQIYSDGTTGQITGNVNVTGTIDSDGLTVYGTASANTVITSDLQDSSNRTLRILDAANNVVWGD